ncbi:MAG: flagellar biosynthesis protein FlhA [Phycisphaerae bacterium]|nr:MAG: flagellar biosynthesis protein FlhA [Planctomycetota bacterium]KAB2939326.1 MAG: flagellar biosynthesis protein FlhA [Phycisphaerae bacterium]MBE7457142.1 flagellar biosynthesis protein FlhA [Planctomycetia bacterium]MCK6463499.1 flagellar biosynthesis protein FlhA [Phycisphaerae bacterium]MCL4718981.1 flagellar biosynthesis protein FlhA [Phycisphaerae bacterium]
MTRPELTRATLTQGFQRHYGMLLPLLAMAMVFALLVPLPTWLMDLLLVVNLAASAVIALTVMYMRGPLEFSSFPTILLGMTLFRLVLNVSTTRLILTNAGSQGASAAGHVVQQFGEFVASGSLVVAIILFAIVVVIQFVVITKGATRIAEVAARFTLDGMPGKQMAVDADLNARIITDEEAKKRRADITREADFYGAMDGASKFVRGDAVAGIVITLINIVGGVLIGWIEFDMTLADTLRTFTVLTIGDGLVSQIPAFIVSIAAAMIVTRSASKRNLGQEVLTQLTDQPTALMMTAGFLLLLAATPLPKAPLLMLAASCAGAAYLMVRVRRQAALAAAAVVPKGKAQSERVEDQLAPDPMGLDVGYGLIRLVDRKQGGDLLDRISNLRKQMAQELGILVPPIRIRDDMKLGPHAYRVSLKGLKIAEGEVMPGHLMAIDAGTVRERVRGTEAHEPAFGLPAVWIDSSVRHDAEHRGYTVVDASSVLITHLSEVIRAHADEILTRQDVHRLLDKLKERSPKLVEDVVPEVLKAGEVQRVLQGLLRERVPIRDLELVLETISDVAGRTKDADILIEYARNALARTICHLNKGDDGKLHCVTLDPGLEESLIPSFSRSDKGLPPSVPPKLQQRIVDVLKRRIEEAMPHGRGRAPVVLCAPQVRAGLRRWIEHVMPSVAVLSYNEIVPDVAIESHGMASIEGAA